MNRYRLIMTRDITESCVVTVDAETEDEAKFAAYDDITSGTGKPIKWEIDEDSCGSSPPYCTDILLVEGTRSEKEKPLFNNTGPYRPEKKEEEG